MNEQLKEEYKWRGTILSNMDGIVSHFSKKDSAQMSLFPIAEDENFQLKEPDDIDYLKIAEMEKDVLGVCLSYDEFSKFILYKLRFCTHSIQDVIELNESNNNIIFIAKVDEIEYLKSKYGNFYSKILLKDSISSIKMYLFGDVYKKNISSVFTNQFYLVKALYDAETQRTNIASIKNIKDINIEDYISSVDIDVGTDIRDIVIIKEATNNLRPGGLKVNFIYDGTVFEHPLKVKFTEEYYLDIKDFVKEFKITKKN